MPAVVVRWPTWAPFLLPPLIGLMTIFGPGFQCIPVLAPVQLLLCLLYCDAVSPRWGVALWPPLTAGFTLAYLSVLGLAATLAVAAVYSAAVIALVFLPVRLLRGRGYPTLDLLAFPISYAGLFALIDLTLPTGSFANPAYAFASVPSVIQLAAVGGLALVNLVIASLVAVGRVHLTPTSVTAHDSIPGQGPSYLLLAVGGLLLYGGARTLDSEGQFFQRGIRSWQRETRHAACVVEDEGISSTNALNITRELAARYHATDPLDVVLWSETMVELHAAEEAPFLAAAAGVAKDSSILLGVTYLVSDTTTPGYRYRNMLTLLLPDGREGFRYQKHHPVPGVEADVAPGPEAVPPLDLGARLGRVAAAICFDFDFPAFIRRVADGADLLLQPGYDWGPLGTLHARMAAVRALENGVTVFRCTIDGVSGVYGPYGQIMTEGVTVGSGYRARIPRRDRVWTPYHALGDTFGGACIVGWALLLLFAFLPPVLPRSLLTRFTSWWGAPMPFDPLTDETPPPLPTA